MTATPDAVDPEARLRDDVGRCFRAALEAVDPRNRVRAALAADPLPGSGDVVVLAVGKAAGTMAGGARDALGERISRGVVLAPRGTELPEIPGVEGRRGGHPLPDVDGVAGARAVAEVAAGTGPGDRVLLLLSGGGSALLTLPPDDVPLAAIRAVTDALLRAGAPIGELNAVRKHLDALKGGRLARLVAPAALRVLVLSDVVGNRLDVVASGPAAPDSTTYADAVDVLRSRGAWDGAPAPVRRHLEAGVRGDLPESPGDGDPVFAAVRTEIVADAGTAARAALDQAEALGYAPELLTTTLTGEARDAGRRLGRLAREIREGERGPEPPAAVAAAGETTVTVTGGGKGGRNQELALGAASELDGLEGVLVASLGTDGVDGPTDAAGARATGRTLARARERGLDPGAALRENDAYPFFRALDDLLLTGPTGTNVMDVQLVLVAGDGSA